MIAPELGQIASFIASLVILSPAHDFATPDAHDETHAHGSFYQLQPFR